MRTSVSPLFIVRLEGSASFLTYYTVYDTDIINSILDGTGYPVLNVGKHPPIQDEPVFSTPIGVSNSIVFLTAVGFAVDPGIDIIEPRYSYFS